MTQAQHDIRRKMKVLEHARVRKGFMESQPRSLRQSRGRFTHRRPGGCLQRACGVDAGIQIPDGLPSVEVGRVGVALLGFGCFRGWPRFRP